MSSLARFALRKQASAIARASVVAVRHVSVFHFAELHLKILSHNYFAKASPMVAKRSMANLSGSVIELSNYLEQRISQKSAEYAAVSFPPVFYDHNFGFGH